MMPTFRLSGNAFERPAQEVLDEKRVIFISTEGTRSEPRYFRFLDEFIHDHYPDAPYILRVLEHNRDQASTPMHVLALLDECKSIVTQNYPFPDLEEIDLSEDDLSRYYAHPEDFSKVKQKEIWGKLLKAGINIDYYRSLKAIAHLDGDKFVVVMDRDAKSHSRETLEEIAQICTNRKDEGFEFYLSNPCFELWLLLHFQDVSSLSVKQQESLLQNTRISTLHTFISQQLSALGHHQKRITKAAFYAHYMPKISTAFIHASRLAHSAETTLDNIGTNLPDLISPLAPWQAK